MARLQSSSLNTVFSGNFAGHSNHGETDMGDGDKGSKDKGKKEKKKKALLSPKEKRKLKKDKQNKK